MTKNAKMKDNREGKYFYTERGDSIAKVDYIRTTRKIYLTHTEVPPALQGQGIASQLVEEILSAIQKEDLTLIPLCPFVAAYLKKHPDWQDLIDPSYSLA